MANISLSEQQRTRAHRSREPGVEYKLRVIEGTNGMLELVEVQPKKQHWFLQWAHLMALANWTV